MHISVGKQQHFMVPSSQRVGLRVQDQEVILSTNPVIQLPLLSLVVWIEKTKVIKENTN